MSFSPTPEPPIAAMISKSESTILILTFEALQDLASRTFLLIPYAKAASHVCFFPKDTNGTLILGFVHNTLLPDTNTIRASKFAPPILYS